jgi:hypothetical protein
MANVKATHAQNVVILNAPMAYMTGVQLVVANKIYQLPNILIPDSMSVQIQSSPLNPANILFAPLGNVMTALQARILRPGEFVNYKVQNARIFQVMGLAPNLVVNVSCEYGG